MAGLADSTNSKLLLRIQGHMAVFGGTPDKQTLPLQCGSSSVVAELTMSQS